jgi:hypothetical protein
VTGEDDADRAVYSVRRLGRRVTPDPVLDSIADLPGWWARD